MANGETAVRAGSRDSGLLALVSLLRFLGKPADPANLKHQFPPDGISVFEIVLGGLRSSTPSPSRATARSAAR
jgi:hypothetical protein